MLKSLVKAIKGTRTFDEKRKQKIRNSTVGDDFETFFFKFNNDFFSFTPFVSTNFTIRFTIISYMYM